MDKKAQADITDRLKALEARRKNKNRLSDMNRMRDKQTRNRRLHHSPNAAERNSAMYSEWLEHLDKAVPPLYQVEGKLPQCPPGYMYDRKRKDCLPKTEKDKISGKLNTNNNDGPGGAHFNVWGKTGINGDGYAYEDPPGTDINSSHWDGPH